MKTTSVLSLISLAAAARAAGNNTNNTSDDDWTATWTSGVYNASVSLIIPGYGVDTDDVNKAVNWTLEERLSITSKQEAVTNLGLRNAAGSIANATDGWSICVQALTYPRKGTGAVDATCKGFVSDDCMKALTASVGMVDGKCAMPNFASCSAESGFGGGGKS